MDIKTTKTVRKHEEVMPRVERIQISPAISLSNAKGKDTRGFDKNA